MKVNLQCNIQILKDAVVQRNLNVICAVVSKFRETLENNNGTVSIYEDFIEFQQHSVFNSLADFNKWVEQTFPGLDC